MTIRIINQNGFSVEMGGSTGMRLLDYPDFGYPSADFKTDKIPGISGEILSSSETGVRDIFLKAEADIPYSLLSRVFAPGTEVEIISDDKWTIKGHISGIKSISRPARMAKPVVNIAIRCFDPYFTKINGDFCLDFDNNGGGIYEGGDYTCSVLDIINHGDVPCPVSVTMRSNASSASTPSGLFNRLDWNSGNPIYTGLIFKKGTDSGIDRFVTTDTLSDRFFESYSVMENCEYFLIPPGKSKLYAQNVTGSLTFTPKFLWIDGRDL